MVALAGLVDGCEEADVCWAEFPLFRDVEFRAPEGMEDDVVADDEFALMEPWPEANRLDVEDEGGALSELVGSAGVEPESWGEGSCRAVVVEETEVGGDVDQVLFAEG